MKHVKVISQHPVYAAPWQDFLCQAARFATDIFEAKNVNIPMVNYIADKCTLPEDFE